MAREERAVPFALWQESGITEHLGGVAATDQLLDRCALSPGQRVLDAGCGTGYSASHLARSLGVSVVAVDLLPQALVATHHRAREGGVSERVLPAAADLHMLPFAAASFDGILAESVLAFCDVSRVAGEFWRVLRYEGCLGLNELTLLAPPAPSLQRLLAQLGICAFAEEEWRNLLSRAGFVDVTSSVQQIDIRTQMANHLRVDGLRRYLASVYQALANSAIRRAFFNRQMLAALRRFRHDVGYGLYSARKQ